MADPRFIEQMRSVLPQRQQEKPGEIMPVVGVGRHFTGMNERPEPEEPRRIPYA